MMRDDDEEEEYVPARPPAYNEQRFDSRIEQDLGYEIEDEYLKEEIADLIYNPPPKLQFGFDGTIEGANYNATQVTVAKVENKTSLSEVETKESPVTKAQEDPLDNDPNAHTLGQQLDTVDEDESDSSYVVETTRPELPPLVPPSKQTRIKVAVKFRPISKHEMVSKSRRKQKEADPEAFLGWETLEDNGKDVVSQLGVRNTVEGKNMFHVDKVYEADDPIEDLYESVCTPITDSVIFGLHGTIFAYGATGGGKSYTIQGGKQVDGIIQMAAKDLFEKIQRDYGREYTVKASYYEIYNEQVRDLLGSADEASDPKSRRATAVLTTVNKLDIDLPVLNIREDSRGTGDVFVDATTSTVANVDGIVRLLYKGNRNRATEKTDSNKFSSRSHAIFRLTVESHEALDDGEDIDETDGPIVRVAALNFVDLAGSENTAKASTTGLRRREGGKINQRYVSVKLRFAIRMFSPISSLTNLLLALLDPNSLLSLSQVIHQLSLPKSKKPAHINYRDSKLTRLLQPHLSGNAAVAIICCASPAKTCVEATRNTLKFGYNAKRIKLKPKVNEIVDDKVLIACLKKELQDTRLKYAQLKEKVKTKGFGAGKKEESEFPMLDAFIAKMSNSAKTIDFVDAVEELSALSGGGGGARRSSGSSARSASKDTAPLSDDDNGGTPEEEEEDLDDVEAFRRQILAKFMAEAMEESGDNLDLGSVDDDDDGDDDVEEDTQPPDMNRTQSVESMMTGFVTETDDDATPSSDDVEDDRPRDRNVTAVFRSTPETRKDAESGDPHVLPLVSNEAEPKRTFLGDAEEKMDESDLNLIEKFRSEILEKFQDEIVDEEAAEELDENAQNVAVIANELITKFKKEIVYKFKDEFPEIQVKRVEVDLSAARVGDNGIVGRVIDREIADGQVNTTDDSSGSDSSVEQFEDEFDDEIKMSESKPKHHEFPKRTSSTLTDRAVVNGHGEGPNGKFLPRSDTGESSLPLRQSLGAGTSGSVSSDLSSDVADRDKGSSNISPEPANPPGGDDDDDGDYAIPPGEIAIGKALAEGNVEGKVRIKFLEEKLAATDELVETLFVELENAKAFIRELVFENAGGGGGIDHSGAALFGAAGTSGVTVVDEQILNQCEILKFGIYTSLLFFVFGQHELFLATVFFLWLSLEVATKA